MVCGDETEEIDGNGALGGVARELVAPGCPDDLRDVGVGVVAPGVAVRAIKVILRAPTTPTHLYTRRQSIRYHTHATLTNKFTVTPLVDMHTHVYSRIS